MRTEVREGLGYLPPDLKAPATPRSLEVSSHKCLRSCVKALDLPSRLSQGASAALGSVPVGQTTRGTLHAAFSSYDPPKGASSQYVSQRVMGLLVIKLSKYHKVGN